MSSEATAAASDGATREIRRGDLFAGPALLPPQGETKRTLDQEFDREATERIVRRFGPILRWLFRARVTGVERIDPRRPGVLVQNHNWSTLGGIEGVAFWYEWYVNQRARRLPQLVGQGGPMANDHRFMRRIGIVRASMKEMMAALRSGRFVATTPGSEVDQLRSVWERTRSRLKKLSWVGGRPVLTDPLAYVAAAVEGGFPIYPVACSGTHEMSPILWESRRILRWSGLDRVRWMGMWPSFPVTLNHLVNFGVFALTPLGASPVAWLLFVLANVYFAPLYSYPLIPVQVRIRVGDPIDVPDLSDAKMSEGERQRIYRAVHAQVVARIDAMLVELDAGRPWVPVFEAIRGLVQRGGRPKATPEEASRAH
jgi:1-acyl-sn-glycerol-3-phosphate acyltransferase